MCVSVCWGGGREGCMLAMSASATGPLYGVIDKCIN